MNGREIQRLVESIVGAQKSRRKENKWHQSVREPIRDTCGVGGATSLLLVPRDTTDGWFEKDLMVGRWERNSLSRRNSDLPKFEGKEKKEERIIALNALI